MNSWSSSVVGMIRWRSLAKTLLVMFLVVLLGINPLTTDSAIAAWGKGRGGRSEPAATTTKVSSKVAETAPPEAIEALRQELDNYQPQVKILSPKSNAVLSTDSVSVQFQVRDLPIFKDKQLGLGPHLHVLLDNYTYQAVYDIDEPLIFKDLDPGTHTIRAFASRPWHESFKNEGAYAQVTFHVYTKTQENSPNPALPLLTYSRPQGTYGAEPIMLDFYLTNAPLHLVAQENNRDDIADWRIRCTVNGESFVLDRWQPLYLKGFKPGKNWVQLEFLDEKGQPVSNVFNNTARVINFEPNGKDTLSRLVRGELAIAAARSIVDPNYVPAPPTPTPTPTVTPTLSPAPTPSPSISPSPSPAPIAPSPTPLPTVSPTPIPEVTPPVSSQPAIAPVPATPAPTTRRRLTPKTDVIPARPAPSPLPTVTPSPAPSPAEVQPAPTPTSTPTPKSDAPKAATPTAPEPSPTVIPSPVKPTPAKPSEAEKDDRVTPSTPTIPVTPSPEVAPATKPVTSPKLPDFLNRFRSGAKTTVPPIARPSPSPTPTPTAPEENTLDKSLENTPEKSSKKSPGQPANEQVIEKSLTRPLEKASPATEAPKPAPKVTPNVTRSPSLPTVPNPQPTSATVPAVERSPAPKPPLPTPPQTQPTSGAAPEVTRSPQPQPPTPTRSRSVPDVPKPSPIPDQVTAPRQPEAIPVKTVPPEAIAPVPSTDTPPTSTTPTSPPTTPAETRSPSRNTNPLRQLSGNEWFNRLRRNFDNPVTPTPSPLPGAPTAPPPEPTSPVEILPPTPPTPIPNY